MAGPLVSEFQGFAIDKPQPYTNIVRNLNVDGQGKVQVGNTYIYNYHRESTADQCFKALRSSTDPRDEKLRIEQTKGGLLRGVYKWILDHPEFRKWQEDNSIQLLWIEGSPGMGKTMLLCGIINELQQLRTSKAREEQAQPSSISFFFCQHTDHRLNGASAVLRGLIYLLVLEQPSLIAHVQSKYDHAGQQAFEGQEAYFTLSGILEELLRNYSGDTCYLVIDALDECQEQLSLLLKLITDMASSCSTVKWVVSSRSIPIVSRILSPGQNTARISLETDNKYVIESINKYIDYRTLELIPSPDEEPLRNELRQQMRLKSGNTFLWIAIVIQELEKTPAFDFLEVLEEQPTGLEELYEAMFRRIKNLPRTKYIDLCRLVISAVFATYRPLHLRELAAIAGLPASIMKRIESVKEIVEMCGTLLTTLDDRVYLIHQSAKDYLTTRESEFMFQDGIEAVHLSLFRRSLEMMFGVLNRDMCQIGHPGTSINNVIRPQNDPFLLIEYPCIYWVNHLNDALLYLGSSPFEELQERGLLHDFLEDHLLHWFEGLSVLKAVPLAGQAILALQKNLYRLQIQPMLTYLTDVQHLFQQYGKTLQEWPLQAYSSALLFSPDSSIAKSWFSTEIPEWVVAPKMIEKHWTVHVAAFEHGRKIDTFIPSPDGTTIISVCERRIWVWDVASSHCLTTISTEDEDINILAFSPDSRFLATASHNRTVRIRDAGTYCSVATFDIHGKQIRDMAFSDDSLRVAATFEDKTTCIWNVMDGTCEQLTNLKGVLSDEMILHVLEGSLNRVSVHENGSLQIWNGRGRSIKRIIYNQTCSSYKQCIVYSASGRYVGFWNPDMTSEKDEVHVWDLESGSCLGRIRPAKDIEIAALSDDGKFLGIVILGACPEVWDTATGTCLTSFKAGYELIQDLMFSSNSQHIIIKSETGALEMLEIRSSSGVTEEAEHEKIAMVVLSHNGQQTATHGRGVTTVRNTSGQSFCATKLRRVSNMVFSLDDKYVAIVFTSGQVELWDVIAEKCVKVYEGKDDARGSVALAPDGSIIAFAVEDCKFRIEETADAPTRNTLVFEGNAPFAFSMDGQQVAAGFGSRNVRLWNMKDNCFRSLEHTESVCAVAFSQDDRRLATVSKDYLRLVTTTEGSRHTVHIWDVSGARLQTIRVPRLDDKVLGKTAISDKPLYINFEKEGSRLRIDRGVLDLGVSDTTMHTVSTQDATWADYGLSNDNEWITYKGQNVLWLPPDHRPWTWATAPSTVAVASQTQRLVVYRFADEGLATPF